MSTRLRACVRACVHAGNESLTTGRADAVMRRAVALQGLAIVFVTNAWMPWGVRARWVSLSGSLRGGASCMQARGPRRGARPGRRTQGRAARAKQRGDRVVRLAEAEGLKSGVAKEQLCPPHASREAGAALAPARPPPDRDSWTRDDSVDDSGLDETGPADDVVVADDIVFARPGASGAAGSNNSKCHLAVAMARASVDGARLFHHALSELRAAQHSAAQRRAASAAQRGAAQRSAAQRGELAGRARLEQARRASAW
jgi:hypothetical protein